MANTAGIIDIKLRAGFDKGAMNGAVRDVGRNMQMMTNRIKEAQKGVQLATATAILPLGAALAGAFAFGGAAAVKFEEQFAAVKKTLDVSAEGAAAEKQFKNIALQLRNLAKFTPASINELTQIAAVGGQLGISADEIVKFTDTIQKLTVATNLSAEQAALSLARLQKITGLASGDIDNLASVIVKLGNNFATTESEIITAATQIATATAGTSTEFNNAATDALAFATALRAVGQPAQAGATAIIRLTQVVDRLVSIGGPDLETVANTAGMTSEAFQELSAIDPALGLTKFIEGLGDIEKSGGDAIAVLEQIGLGQIRTRRAIMALSRAEGDGGMGLLTQALGMANTEFAENTALLTEAERRYETVASQVKVLRNIVNEAGISFGEKFLPSINNVVQGLANVLTSVTDFDKRVKGLRNIGIPLTALGATVYSVVTAFKSMTAGTLEYAAATSMARAGVTGLTDAQNALLFQSQSKGPGGLFFKPLGGFMSGFTGLREIQKPIMARAGVTGLPDVQMEGPFPIGEVGQGLLKQTTMVQSKSRMSDSFLQTNEALKKLAKSAGTNRIQFLRQNLAFRDSGRFLENITNAIKNYNATSGQTILLTNQLRGGMMGLAQAARAVGVAIRGVGLAIGKALVFMGAFQLIFSAIERIGARRRSMDEFASNMNSLTESFIELEKSRTQLEALGNLRENLIGDGADAKTIEAVEEKIESLSKSIRGMQAAFKLSAGANLETLVFGQKGGKGLENRLENVAEDFDLDKDELEKQIFGGLSELVTDVASGKKTTVGDLIQSVLSTDFGDEEINKALTNVEESFGLLKAMQSGVTVPFLTGDIDIEAGQIDEVNSILRLYKDVFDIVLDDKIMNLADSDIIKDSAILLQGKAKFLNDVQELLVTRGAITEAQKIDATNAQNFERAQALVMRNLAEETGTVEEVMADMNEEFMNSEIAIQSLSEAIDESLSQSLENAINGMQQLPEAARITAIEFSKNLVENLKIQEQFEKGILELSEVSPLVARQLASVGPEAMNVLNDFLAAPMMAGSLEEQLSKVVGPELAQQAAKMIKDNKNEFEKAGEDLGDGIVKGVKDKAPELTQTFTGVIDDAIQEILDKYGIKSPSEWTRKNIGNALIDGIILGIHDRQSMLAKESSNALMGLFSGYRDDLRIYTDFKDAQRGIIQAQSAELQAQIALNSARRDAASFNDRYLKGQKELAELEITGRKGVITLDEEISLLRKKISLEDKIKKAGGNKSAQELLEIQRAEENIQDLRAMGAKGVISNLELQAAEERLAALKGEDITEDDRKLAILELTATERDLTKAREEALETDDALISARQTVIDLENEKLLLDSNLKISEDNIASAKERTVDAQLKYNEALATLNQEIAYDGEFLNNLSNIEAIYGGISGAVNEVIAAQNSLLTTVLSTTPQIKEALAETLGQLKGGVMDMGIYMATLTNFMGSGEYNTFMNALSDESGKSTTAGTFDSGFFQNFHTNFRDYFNSLMPTEPFVLPDYGMGGRVKKYKYGGRGDPMTRALVGEYGPEEVKFIPGNGFMVKPLGTGKSGTVVNNLNVNVTGVPSDPISARKAAVQISKALKKLDKEGSSGTGLRRN